MVALRNRGVIVVANIGEAPVPLPEGSLLLASGPLLEGSVPVDTTVWVAVN